MYLHSLSVSFFNSSSFYIKQLHLSPQKIIINHRYSLTLSISLFTYGEFLIVICFLSVFKNFCFHLIYLFILVIFVIFLQNQQVFLSHFFMQLYLSILLFPGFSFFIPFLFLYTFTQIDGAVCYLRDTFFTLIFFV